MDPIIQDGVNVMIYGMGVVFSFLTLLVFAIIIMSTVAQKWFPEEEPLAKPKPNSKASPININPLTLKVIQAAIEKHRKR